MAESDSEPRRGGAAVRVGGLAVVVVLAVVLARARAAGATPPVSTPSGSVIETVLRIAALALMVTGVVLLLWGRRLLGVAPGGARDKRKRAPAEKPSRRVVIACLIGLLVALGLQMLGNVVGEEKRELPPPSMTAQPAGSSQLGRERQPGGETESGILDEVILVTALLTFAALIFVLVRRNAAAEEHEEEDTEQEAMARAVRAARKAVLNRAITDPRAAIVACFAAMEAALADRGGPVTPLDADTPEEVLTRGIERASLPAPAAATLLRLFREARFSTHPITEQDRTDADEALAVLLRALHPPARAPAGEPAPGGSS